ncbi:MAG TPA: hypothetical protein VFE16_12215 [Candidatus Cybelea sp.]|jgi:hypothetical protein|nr:hypothetical protein [Candidatus Cybelea sp.]
MAYGYRILLLAIDDVQSAVSQELSSRYCPFSKTVFLTRFWTLFALLLVAAFVIVAIARRRRQGASDPLQIVAGVLLLFAIGSGALVLYGLSGCSGAAAAGLIRDWP